MPFKITCQCDRVLVVPDRRAGAVIRCPKCERKIQIPNKLARKSPPPHLIDQALAEASEPLPPPVEGRAADTTDPVPPPPPNERAKKKEKTKGESRRKSESKKQTKRSKKKPAKSEKPKEDSPAPEPPQPPVKLHRKTPPERPNEPSHPLAPKQESKSSPEPKPQEQRDTDYDLDQLLEEPAPPPKQPPPRNVETSKSDDPKPKPPVRAKESRPPKRPHKSTGDREGEASAEPKKTSAAPNGKKPKTAPAKPTSSRPADSPQSVVPSPQRRQPAPRPQPTPQPEPDLSASATTGYRADRGRRQTVIYMACWLIVIAVTSLVPAGLELSARSKLDIWPGVPLWIYILILFAGIQVAYSVYLIQLPDWSTIWVVSVVTLIQAMIYAMLLGISLLATIQSPLLQSLELTNRLRGGSIGLWCVVMVCLYCLFSYFGGRFGLSWRNTRAKMLRGLEPPVG